MEKVIDRFNNLEVEASTRGEIIISIQENDNDTTKLSLTKDNVKWLITALKQAKELAFN